ncbi:hypothetical protein LQ567_01350 [Niabella pedocola]|uniref:Uncharacterized protein n=1 Tax=Niabella pedocola TaxID=1752077 RepID=A0ABS8PJY6_9BACT|nr:hypothetical protein [Niabella pedocola]MCD2421389.1 hypothetical protein [Niabella pedocola]
MISDPVVIYNSVLYFIPFFNEKGIKTFHIYKNANGFSRTFRKIFGILGLNRNYWLGDWKNEIKEGSTVILFANDEVDVWKLLSKKKVIVIFWYWNPVSIYPKGQPSKLPAQFIPYSFDPRDCRDFHLSFNTTFYFDNIPVKKVPIKRDILFVGLDKGRKKELDSLKETFHKLGITNYIYMVGARTRWGSHKGNQPIPYQQYLDLIFESNAILDITQDTQTGLTLRVMESIFFRKKLITNDLSITKQTFYHPQNIFILGRDDIGQLKSFLNSGYLVTDQNIDNRYDVSQWITRFKTDHERTT